MSLLIQKKKNLHCTYLSTRLERLQGLLGKSPRKYDISYPLATEFFFFLKLM